MINENCRAYFYTVEADDVIDAANRGLAFARTIAQPIPATEELIERLRQANETIKQADNYIDKLFTQVQDIKSDLWKAERTCGTVEREKEAAQTEIKNLSKIITAHETRIKTQSDLIIELNETIAGLRMKETLDQNIKPNRKKSHSKRR